MKVIDNYRRAIENSDENLLQEVLLLKSASRPRLEQATIIP
jgi:hypothetical protein